jgi:hypothetical protein
MASNLLEQLAEIEVPTLPAEFDRKVHRRLNHRLLLSHLADLAVRGLPFAFLHFLQALVGLVTFSLTGQHENKPPCDPNDRAADE